MGIDFVSHEKPVVDRVEKFVCRRHPKPMGVWRHAPPEIFTFGVSEMPSPAFSAGHFQSIKTKENTVISCLFYPSLALSVKYRLITAKKGKTVTPPMTLQAGQDVYPPDGQTLLYLQCHQLYQLCTNWHCLRVVSLSCVNLRDMHLNNIRQLV